jgi:epoxide hydrolase-like predicted phosphatase
MQVVVFDFFGVICSEIAPFVLPKYMSPEAAVLYKSTMVHKADLGQIGLDEVLEHLSGVTGVSAAQLKAEFWSYVKIDAEMVALIESLRKNYRTALLSNAIKPFLREVLAKHDLERLFDVILVSAEEGIAKPDPAFFQQMIDKLGVPAKECLFIDDNIVNVETAKLVGMQAVLFAGVEDLRTKLAQA